MMNKKYPLIIAVTILGAVLLACNFTPPPPIQPTGVVETKVAETLQALLQDPGGGVQETPPAVFSVLPAPLYFLKPDAGGVVQVYRLDRDGASLVQITHEVSDVEDYSIAPDGRLAYVAKNQLLLEDPDGSGRVILLDGGPQDINNPYVNRVSSPVWSPDGQTIAFGFHGLNFYTLASWSYINRVADVIEDMNGMLIPRELFFPADYSPDGRLLLLNIGWYEGGTYGIYDMGSGILSKPSMQGILCCTAEWNPGSSAVYFASSSMGMIESGLWRLDANGTVTTLLPAQAADGTWNFADYPLMAPDGQLYFFFANHAEIPSGHTPLMMVHSAPDGVTGRSDLLPSTYMGLNDALWAPDGSLVILVEPTSETMWYGGRMTAIYLDGSEARTLAEFGSDLKWGP